MAATHTEDAPLFSPTAQLKIAVTSWCNNECRICFRDTRRSKNGTQGELSRAVIEGAVADAADLGMVGAYWTGGEPLLRYGDLLDLVAFARDRGLVSTIVTNAGILGAAGRYRDRNRALLERAGACHLEAGGMVRRLERAGLVRVMISVDNSHNTLLGADAAPKDRVPTAAVAGALGALLDQGFGRRHALEAIGHRLRLSATSSGRWRAETEQILEDVRRRAGLSPAPETGAAAGQAPLTWRDHRGAVAVKHLQTFALGAARRLSPGLLEDRRGDGLFEITCANFKQPHEAYDDGSHHGDLSIDHLGVVALCGNGMFPIGNIHQAPLRALVENVRTGRGAGPFAASTAVLHRLLRLSREHDLGDRAIGTALSLVHQDDPRLLSRVATEGGGCRALSRDPRVQSSFIRAFDRRFD